MWLADLVNTLEVERIQYLKLDQTDKFDLIMVNFHLAPEANRIIIYCRRCPDLYPRVMFLVLSLLQFLFISNLYFIFYLGIYLLFSILLVFGFNAGGKCLSLHVIFTNCYHCILYYLFSYHIQLSLKVLTHRRICEQSPATR